MKHLKFVFLTLGCIAVLSLTSCIKSEENDSGLTQKQISDCLTAVRGDYTGHLLYTAYNALKPIDDTDTLDVSWTITSDTLLIVRRFPLAPITEKMVDQNLKKAILEQDPYGELKCDMSFIMIDPYVEFMVGARAMDVPVFYKEQTHSITVYFWFNDYTFGAKNPLTQEMNIYLRVAGAYLDGDTSNNLLNRDFSQPVDFPMVLTNIDFNK